MIGFVIIALLEQNHKIKDWRIDIKKAVSKDSSSSNQGYSSNRGEERGFNGGFGNFGRGFGDRERGGGGPAPWNSGPMGPPFSNEGMGGGWGGGMGGDMGGGMGGDMGGMGGSMGNTMDGPIGGGMNSGMGGGMGNMGGGMGNMGGGMGNMGGGTGNMSGGMGNSMGAGMGNQNRNNPWNMQSGGMGGGNNGNMGGMNSSWENQGGRGNGNNFGNDGPIWNRNMENDNMGDMMGAGFSTGMGGGSMSNRGMPYNGGMGGPGPMRSHMGGGNVYKELNVSMEIMFANLYKYNKRRKSQRREISKSATVLKIKTCIQTNRLNLTSYSNLALI